MKIFKVLVYLYRYAKDLYESDGLREKNLNESAQLKASALILKSNIELIEATEKISTALEKLGKNLEKLASIRPENNSETIEEQLNEIGVRARLMSEHQVPGLVSLFNESKRLVSEELCQSSEKSGGNGEGD